MIFGYRSEEEDMIDHEMSGSFLGEYMAPPGAYMLPYKQLVLDRGIVVASGTLEESDFELKMVSDIPKFRAAAKYLAQLMQPDQANADLLVKNGEAIIADFMVAKNAYETMEATRTRAAEIAATTTTSSQENVAFRKQYQTDISSLEAMVAKALVKQQTAVSVAQHETEQKFMRVGMFALGLGVLGWVLLRRR